MSPSIKNFKNFFLNSNLKNASIWLIMGAILLFSAITNFRLRIFDITHLYIAFIGIILIVIGLRKLVMNFRSFQKY